MKKSKNVRKNKTNKKDNKFKKRLKKDSKENSLEKEWRKMRKELENKLDPNSEKNSEEKGEDEGELEEDEKLGDRSLKFGEFFPSKEINTVNKDFSSGDFGKNVPVLERIEKIEDNNFSVSNNFNMFDNNDNKKKNETTVDYVADSRRGGNRFYSERARGFNFQPPVLSPRDTLPPDKFVRERLLDPSEQMAGGEIRDIYPESLEPDREEGKEKYFKSPEDSY